MCNFQVVRWEAVGPALCEGEGQHGAGGSQPGRGEVAAAVAGGAGGSWDMSVWVNTTEQTLGAPVRTLASLGCSDVAKCS